MGSENEMTRYSGILVHPTSFPSPYGIGDMGQGAYDFIDFLHRSGQTLWQCLPLGPTGFGDSPYQSFSSFAGQPLIISPDLLVQDGLLQPEDLADYPQWTATMVDYGPAITYKTSILEKSYTYFKANASRQLQGDYELFCAANAYWLENYALFMALKHLHHGCSWLEWEPEYKFLTPETQTTAEKLCMKDIGYYKYIQFIFTRQWQALKTYANERGIAIVGDIPIFVSSDSADVWANKDLFQLDSQGYPTAVAGVPPDYFSATGQLWGNPLYDWERHSTDDYDWWVKRIARQLEFFDYLRIDHFRGFEAYWAIPYGDDTAIGGTWKKGPGEALFSAMEERLGTNLPIFAEDLGVITPEVNTLRDTFHFPGMKVLQFGFEDLNENAFLPHQFANSNCICYTGTHDNDTTQGWYNHAPHECRNKVRVYMNSDDQHITWNFIRTALASTAKYAIFPLQDLLGLDSNARMNTPGTADGNWTWRYTKEMLHWDLAGQLHDATLLYGRLGANT